MARISKRDKKLWKLVEVVCDLIRARRVRVIPPSVSFYVGISSFTSVSILPFVNVVDCSTQLSRRESGANKSCTLPLSTLFRQPHLNHLAFFTISLRRRLLAGHQNSPGVLHPCSRSLICEISAPAVPASF